MFQYTGQLVYWGLILYLGGQTKIMKVVINTCCGGFGLSDEAKTLLREKTGKDWRYGPPRNLPELIEVIVELGDAANGQYAKLRIIEIPDDVDWEIAENDGFEWVAERHRIWQA
jgi:hypothetical protein